MPNAIMPSEIEAWARTLGIRLMPWEYGALYAMDVARRNSLSKPLKSLVPDQNLTHAAFHALTASHR